MAEFIKRAERKTASETVLVWSWKDSPGSGYSFPCDDKGAVDVDSLPDAARANYQRLMAGDDRLTGPEIETREWRYTEPGVIRCHCGRLVTLHSDPETCDCGADYNLGGQLLAPRRFWGEETGEQF